MLLSLHWILLLLIAHHFFTRPAISTAQAFGATEFVNPKDYQKPIQEVWRLRKKAI